MVVVAETPPSVAVARAHIRCTETMQHGRLKGEICDKLLAEPRIAFWEIDMASEALLSCEKCGQKYTLAKYMRVERTPT